MSQFNKSILVLGVLLTTGGVARAGEDADLASQVGAILRQRCASCHGEEKHKGKLRLDNAAAIDEASRRMQLVVAGAPDKSVLLQRIALPADDVDVMPPEGDPLPSVQVALFRRWIALGAKLTEFDEPKHVSTRVEEKLPLVSAAEPRLLEKLKEMGAVVTPVARDVSLLDVGFPENPGRITDAELAVVVRLAERIRRLDLSRTAITQNGLRLVASLPNLHTLHLRGTAINEDALPVIMKMAALRRINIAETTLSPSAIQSIAKQRPELAVWGSIRQ